MSNDDSSPCYKRRKCHLMDYYIYRESCAFGAWNTNIAVCEALLGVTIYHPRDGRSLCDVSILIMCQGAHTKCLAPCWARSKIDLFDAN